MSRDILLPEHQRTNILPKGQDTPWFSYTCPTLRCPICANVLETTYPTFSRKKKCFLISIISVTFLWYVMFAYILLKYIGLMWSFYDAKGINNWPSFTFLKLRYFCVIKLIFLLLKTCKKKKYIYIYNSILYIN